MPDHETSVANDYPAPRNARSQAQIMLGQIQGVVWLAVNDVDLWLESERTTDDGEPGLTADDVRQAGAEVQGHFGAVNAALNTGKYDQDLVRVGMTGAQGNAKKKGFLPGLSRLFGTSKQAVQDHIVRLRTSLRWSGTLIGSITAALKKEIDRVPGAGAAGEAIKEFIDLLMNATEPHEPFQSGRRQVRGGSGEDRST